MAGKKKTQFISVILGVGLIAVIGMFLFTGLSSDGKNEFSKNVTDVVMKDGEIVSYKYNGFDFVNKEGIWYTEVQPAEQPFIISFTYGPINVEDLEIEFQPNDFQRLTKPYSNVYVTFDHDMQNLSYIATSAINLISNLKTVWAVNASRACLKESENCFNGAPVVACESNPENAVIQFIEQEDIHILYEDNCLTIRARGDDFIRASEKVILDWYGIV